METQRLIIREVREEDFPALLSIYTQPETMKYISSGKYDWTMEELRAKYDRINTHYAQGFGIFAVQLADQSTVIGEAGLFNSFDNPAILELGYILDRNYWHQGYGKEICQELIRYCKEELETEKVVARMYAENEASVRLSEATGMTRIETGTTPQGKTFYTYEIVFRQ
ncbi:MAG: GNAT family N-acetyltransferase [Tannerellaceae bacterium]|nr:GNAT family N-acetyltransferase [Tannerellaceae bacterium]